MQPLIQSCRDPDPQVRQAAVYGVGVCAQYGGALFAAQIGEALNVIHAIVNAPNARDEEYSQRFVDKILPLSEVQSALSNNAETIQEMFEMYSEGRDFLEIDQWIKALESKMLISNVKVHGHQVRLTEPQVKAAFYASAATPSSGITPEELPALIARCGYDKYRNVAPMGAGAKVDAFMQNLLGKADEEDVIAAATGGGTVPSFQGAHESVPKRSSKEAVEEEEEEEEYEEEEEDVDDEE